MIHNHIFSYCLFFLGYVLLSLARQTIPIVLPLLINLVYTDPLALSYFFAWYSFFYGIFKFVNGIIMDLKNCPLFMFGLGHIISGLATISIPFLYKNLILLLFVLMLLAWAQAMGWPAITKFIIKNFDSCAMASLWGIMSVSHQLGSCVGLILLPSIIRYSIKNVFLYSGSLCLFFGIYIILHASFSRKKSHLRHLATYQAPISTGQARKLLKFFVDMKISSSILLLCCATFCVYIVNMGIFFWFPLILKDILQVSLLKSSLITGIHDLGGMIGALITGKLSDVYFSKKRNVLAVIYMLITAFIFIVMNFYQNPIFLYLNAALSGFLIWGVQVLTTVIATEIAPKNNVCTMVSLTGLFGYISTSIFSCVVLGLVVKYFGNNFVFLFFCICSVIASICFASLLNKH
ncbi:MFS transporter [Candidatus Cardinium hertigii]|jgi:OPA family glycerol-3-phosphate transporter-like MFS transporter|uniref:MFS transporter n=1 Tax=Candidatus Cardinium hertigii TaxID=247481 RepID=A0A3N2QCV8_9BACT|nr:MFS transporter [Candidatus Cardinium hertigii]ROT47620.1 MFS transporter [Candidatus Cardinium hertigii]